MEKKLARQMGSREARERLTEIVTDAAKGVPTIVTRFGRNMAVLLSARCSAKTISWGLAATKNMKRFDEALAELMEENAEILADLAKLEKREKGDRERQIVGNCYLDTHEVALLDSALRALAVQNQNEKAANDCRDLISLIHRHGDVIRLGT